MLRVGAAQLLQLAAMLEEEESHPMLIGMRGEGEDKVMIKYKA